MEPPRRKHELRHASLDGAGGNIGRELDARVGGFSARSAEPFAAYLEKKFVAVARQ